MKSVLFYRNYQGFTGGHLKVFDYYRHLNTEPSFRGSIFFDKRSVFDDFSPWTNGSYSPVANWVPLSGDILFLGGLDWLSLDVALRPAWPKPVINLIQNVRHAEVGTALHEFLGYRAIRICVSMEVEEAVRGTGRVNGPLFCIPNGIDLSAFPVAPTPLDSRQIDLLIYGIKQPDLAHELAIRFNNGRLAIKVLTSPISRSDFLTTLQNCKVSVLLPNSTEGFFLPSIEAMAAGTLVVCPDCIGNRSHCIDLENSIRPTYDLETIVAATQIALNIPAKQAEEMRLCAITTAARHSLEREKSAFIRILHLAESLWHEG